MPLEVGLTRTYVVTYNLQRNVEPVRVTREVPILGATGYELSGAMGTSRLVWKNGVLYASQAANARFDPPIPIAAVDAKPIHWTGKLESLENISNATGELVQKKEKIDLGSRRFEATLCVLTITLPRGTIELSSWFQPGVGLVRQEQRTGNVRVLQMEMLPNG